MKASSDRRAGRRAGLIAFGVLVTAFTVVCSVQILVQVWAPDAPSTDMPCTAGIRSLLQAVDRAREAAAREINGEREAIARFRETLEPEWRYRQALSERCRDDAAAMKALRDVDHYRYAEEHAVRYAASNLSRLRQKMLALHRSLSSAEDAR